MSQILHVIRLSKIAGAEKHLLRLLPELRAAGLDVRLLVLHTAAKASLAETMMRTLADSGVPVEELTIPYTRSLIFSLKTPSIFWRLRHYFRTTKPHAVHTHLIYADFFGTLAARAACVPYVISTRRNTEPFYEQIPWQMVTWILWRFIDRGTAVSEAVRQFAIRTGHVSVDKIETIAHGLEPWNFDEEMWAQQRIAVRREWAIPLDAPVIGTVGRLVPKKGLDYALDAFAEVRETVLNAHYVIVGDGPLRDALERRAAKLGILPAVRFLGWREDIAAVLNGLDLFLAPFLFEGMSNSILEAMARRLPLVAADNGPNAELVVHGKTGYLATPAQAQSLVKPLLRLLTDLDLARKMGQAGRERLETDFSMETMVEGYVDMYRRVAGNIE